MNNCKILRQQRKEKATLQQHEAADPNYTVWVEASAGTGKTKVLSDRVLRLLLNNVNPMRILCLTYTKAAAVEMNTRISKRLSEWSVISDEKLHSSLKELFTDTEISEKELTEYQARARTLFAVLLDTPGGLKIQTLHSFCEELLKRFPLEAGVSPYFDLLNEMDSADIIKRVQNDLLRDSFSAQNSPLGKAMSYLSEKLKESVMAKVMENIRNDRIKITELLESYGDLTGFLSALRAKLDVNEDDDENSLISAFMQSINLEDIRQNIRAYLHGATTDITRAEFLEECLRTGFKNNDYEQYRGLYLKADNQIMSDSKLASKDAKAADEQLLFRLSAEAQRVCAFEQKLNKLRLYKSTAAVFTIASELSRRYLYYKRQRAQLDFDDLILYTRELLSDPAAASWVLYKLDGGIDHILLDESQDTSPEQWDIIKYLSAEFFAGSGQSETIRTVFAVGDRKQSIYSFQGANLDKFDDMFRYFKDRAGANFKKVQLKVSFRSAPAVINTVNGLFSGHAAKGVVTSENYADHLPAREGEYGRVEIWDVFTAASDKDKDKNTKEWLSPIEMKPRVSVRSRLAQAIAEKIKAMIAASSASDHPLHFKDFMVLVRHRSGFVEDFIRACKERNVNISGADKMVLSKQIAIQDLVSLGKFLLLPNDDLSLAEVLKSPLFGLTDDDLEILCCRRKNIPLWIRLGDNPKYRETYSLLRELTNRFDYIRPYELYNYVLVNMEGRRKFIARMGQEVEDALDEFINLTLDYERSHIPDLQGFISWFCRNQVVIKRESEEAQTDAVRLMTVHHSKGLQAPIVFLPDTIQLPTVKNGQGFLYDDIAYYPLNKDSYDDNCLRIKEVETEKMLEEYRRLLYVALTRAEDCLFICGYSNTEKISDDAWFKLCKDCLEGIGVKQDKITEYHSESVVAKETKQRHFDTTVSYPAEEWIGAPVSQESPLSKPYTPSNPLEDEDADSSSPLNETGNFYLRGSLIHKILQFIDGNDEDKAGTISAFLAKCSDDFSPRQRENIKAEIMSLLENPRFKDIFGTASRAEVAVAGVVDGKIISAQLDRLVVLPDKVMVVDFKTNRPAAEDIASTPPVYIKQLQTYTRLMQEIYPTKAVEGYILWTNETRLMRVV